MNKRGTSKVGAISKAKKLKLYEIVKGDPLGFLKKKSKNKNLSHSAEKLERGDPLGFLKLQFAVKYQKNLKGGPFGDKKISKKSHNAEKNKGDPIVSSCFVSYDKNGVTERGDPLPYPKCAPRLPVQ